MVRIILVEPEGPENLGMIARAMANMGHKELYVVSPACDILSSPSLKYALHARGILENAIIVSALEDALLDCDISFALTRRQGQYRQPDVYLPELGNILTGLEARKLGFIFGRERNGLLAEEVMLCDMILTIPSSSDYPSLNLAQAVMLVLYELMRISFNSMRKSQKPRLDEQIEKTSISVKKVLRELGYYKGLGDDKVDFIVRKAVSRASANRKAAVRIENLFSHILSRIKSTEDV
ncbi:RNA methyltransferase [Spirochaetia bacterium 38H-sp]|uniref:RNA methyltransferase n=1 Tax=Rarispira pelagica TaxID=3141764 RepID=A0ABU9U8T5_9SPIR